MCRMGIVARPSPSCVTSWFGGLEQRDDALVAPAAPGISYGRR
jgi:hypothetical protein